MRRIRPILGQDLLKPKPGINDLAVAEGGENGTKELNLTVPKNLVRLAVFEL